MNGICGLLGKLPAGDGHPIRIMGVLNLSPESFYKKSVVSTADLIEHARSMKESGADIFDVGGMSTAPYLDTEITAKEEIDRIVPAIRELDSSDLGVPISVDTQRREVAEKALVAGATIINDVSSIKNVDVYKVAAEYGASLIVLPEDKIHARSNEPVSREQLLASIIASLDEKVDLAVSLGVDRSRIAIDPGMGFMRRGGIPWYDLDSFIIANLNELRKIDRPLLIGVSRKSFIGKILGAEDPSQRLYGSLAATAIAVFNGAHAVRTHDVAETRQVVDLALELEKSKAVK